MSRSRVVFMGTPEFAVPVLEMLVQTEEVVGIYTQPDKPAGRGRQLTAPPVKQWAAKHAPGIPVLQPRTLRDAAAQAQLAELKPDVIVVAAFGLLLPKPVLDLPPHGCINVHASLLPKYRGAAPIPAAILNGDAETGITLMKLDPGLDTGPMLAQAREPIGPTDTAGTLAERLARLGTRLLAETLPRWIAGQITPQPQDDAQATLAGKLDKQDGRLDWHKTAAELDRQIRAFTPWPGAFTTWNGKLLRVLSAGPEKEKIAGEPGLVVPLEGGLGVVTGSGVLRLVQIQLEGKRAMTAQEFMRGQPALAGSVLGR